MKTWCTIAALPLLVGVARSVEVRSVDGSRADRADQGHFAALKLHIEVDLPHLSVGELGLWAAREALLDRPAEIVLEVDATRALRDLRLFDARGDAVLEMLAHAKPRLGMSEISIEHEAAALRDLTREYPEGEYQAVGTTLDGATVIGTVTLRHSLPGPFTVVWPARGSALPTEDVTMAWTPSNGAARYVLELEQEASGFAMELTLSPEHRSVRVPRSLLPPEGEIEYSLLVQGDTDNELEIEGRFELAH